MEKFFYFHQIFALPYYPHIELGIRKVLTNEDKGMEKFFRVELEEGRAIPYLDHKVVEFAYSLQSK